MTNYLPYYWISNFDVTKDERDNPIESDKLALQEVERLVANVTPG